MYEVSESVFQSLISKSKFVKLDFDISATLSKDVLFYGMEIGRDVLIIGIYNTDICTVMNVLKNAHIVYCNGRYTVRDNQFVDSDTDNLFFHPETELMGVMEHDNFSSDNDFVQVSQITDSSDNILDEQLASAEKLEKGFAIGDIINEKQSQTIKRITDSIQSKIDDSSDIVNKEVIKEIEPKFKKVQEEMIEASVEKPEPINPKPIVTTGRRVNDSIKMKESVKITRDEKPKKQKEERKVVKASEYIEEKPSKNNYWGL